MQEVWSRVNGLKRDSGQSLAEYALIVALIVIVALVALTLFGTQINDILSMTANQINGSRRSTDERGAGRDAVRPSTDVLYRDAAPLRDIRGASRVWRAES